MNILEQTEALKDLPDQALIQQMQMPTGEIAPIFITSELRRRKRMRDDYARREAADTPTVAEEVVMAAGMPQGGIADAARALAPKTNMGQNTGMADMMPRAATQAPERMAEGGIVRMAKGGRTQVEYNGRGYFVFADGDVQDALGRPVSDELAQAVKASLETPPERQEGTASLGSEILADASPQAPGLESVLSSDRPFSPLSMEVTDTRPAIPSSLGMGGERPSTLTDVTQPAFNQEQALIDAMSPAFDRFGGEPLATAEEISNLSGPSISDVSPTVDLDLTTQPDLSEMEKARLATQFTQQQELARAIRNQQAQPQAQPYEGGEYTNAKRDFDVMVPTIDRDSSIDQQLLSKALEERSLPITPTEDFRREFADYGDDISPFDPSDIKSNAQRAVSDLGLTPITRDGEEYFISPAGMVFKQEGDDLVPVAGGEAMQAMDVAQRQGKDFSVSPMGMIPIGTRDVDPTTGLIDPDSPFVPASLDASGAKTPQFLTDALGPGSTVSDFLNVQEGAAPVTNVDETNIRVAPASPAEDVVGFGAQPGYDDYPMPAPITMGDAPVGIEAARPEAAPVALKAERDAAKISAPDGGGITTVSTKAINDAAKSTGLGADAWLAIAKGGAAIAASKNPTLLGALGEGAGVAASSLMAQRASDKAASLKQDQIDATLEAARIRAAATGRAKTMAPPTGSSVLTYLSGQLDQAKLDLQTLESAKSRTKKTADWKLDKVRTEQEIERLQRDINTLLYGGSVASAGGVDDVTKIKIS